MQAKGSIDMTQQEAQPDISQLKGNDEEVESRSIYVKNLAWSTKDAGLMKHFDAVVSASGGSVRYGGWSHSHGCHCVFELSLPVFPKRNLKTCREVLLRITTPCWRFPSRKGTSIVRAFTFCFSCRIVTSLQAL